MMNKQFSPPLLRAPHVGLRTGLRTGLCAGLCAGLCLFIAACGAPTSTSNNTIGTSKTSTSQGYKKFATVSPDSQSPQNAHGRLSRIVESTQALLRALPRGKGGPTAYDSAPEKANANRFFDSAFSAGTKSLAKDDGRIRIGLLLPLGAENKDVKTIAYDLLNAAQLAMFDVGQPAITLIIEDTKGTPDGAAQAAKKAIRNGAQLIIGPLFAGSVKAVHPIVRRANVPTLAFSNNRAIADKIAGKGVWLIGFLPEQNLERILAEANAQGLTRIAALIPETDYGRRIEAALGPMLEQLGGELVQIETYQDEAQSMFDPAQKIARYEERKQAWADERQRLTEEAARILATLLEVPPVTEVVTEIVTKVMTEAEEIWAQLGALTPLPPLASELQQEYEALARVETFGEFPYDAVLIPEGGIKLRSLAPLLPYFDVDPREIKFIGTGLWDDPVLGQEPPLIGGWYAAPQPNGWKKFSKRYEAIYGHRASRLATLAYDGISLAAALSAIDSNNPFSRKNLTSPDGFQGIDGIFRLTEDGLNERGLAVLEVRRKQNRMVSPAPDSFVLLDRRTTKINLPKGARASKPSRNNDNFSFPFFD